jgi:hypothetical protein
MSQIQGQVAAVGNLAGGGSIGTAGATVDIAETITCNQTTAAQTLTIPNPTDNAIGHRFEVINIGSTSFTMLGAVVAAGGALRALWSGTAWAKIS